MAFVDEITLHLEAGDGGDGVVRWLKEKFREFGGPAGGDGGDGGDVYIRAVRDIGLLSKYRGAKEFSAGDGEDGRRRSQKGKDGDDLVLDLPVGSVVENKGTGERYELLEEGEKYKVLAGGRGGYGNEHFKSSTNQRPQEWTSGTKGEEADFYIELELVVDAGFVGLPNAGKSSLVTSITNARSKVAPYEFTTLEPHLGALYGFVLADIPGLIKGASKGKGLGHKFLRHVKRTKLIIHCVSLEEKDVLKAYKAIRSELTTYEKDLEDKPEAVVLTKSDVVEDPREIEVAKQTLSKYNDTIFITSILDDESLKEFSDSLVKILRDATENTEHTGGGDSD